MHILKKKKKKKKKKDDLDAYLQRFERFATTAKWEKTGRASKLSALLSGRALEIYSQLQRMAIIVNLEHQSRKLNSL